MKEVYLSDILEEVSARNRDLGNIPVRSVTNQEGFCSPRDFFSKDVCSKDLSNYKIVKKGEFAYNPSRINVGSIDFLHEEIALVSPLYVIFKCKESLVQEYLKYYLKGEKGNIHIRLKARGAVRDTLSFKSLSEIKIPLYPFNDQKQIVRILDTADTLRQKRKEQLNLLDEYLKSVFFEMFEDPVRNEKGWNSCKVIDVCDCIVPGRDKPKSFTGSMPWVTTDDLECLGWTLSSKKNVGLTSEEISTVRAKVIPKDSVIMTCVGDLGVISIAKNEFVMNQQLHAFICSERIKNIFLMFSLFFQKGYMLRMASSTTVPYMNKTICNSVPVLLPPIELQNKFASIVEQVEQTKQKMRASLDEMDKHFNALMQRYFG